MSDSQMFEITVCSKVRVENHELRAMVTITYGELLGSSPQCSICRRKKSTQAPSTRFLMTIQDFDIDYRNFVQLEQVTAIGYERRCCYRRIFNKNYESSFVTNLVFLEESWPQDIHPMPRLHKLAPTVGLQVENFPKRYYQQRTFFIVPAAMETSYTYFMVQYEPQVPALLLLEEGGFRYPVVFYVIAYEKNAKINTKLISLLSQREGIHKLQHYNDIVMQKKKGKGHVAKPGPDRKPTLIVLPSLTHRNEKELVSKQPRPSCKIASSCPDSMEKLFAKIGFGLENSYWAVRCLDKNPEMKCSTLSDKATSRKIYKEPLTKTWNETKLPRLT